MSIVLGIGLLVLGLIAAIWVILVPNNISKTTKDEINKWIEDDMSD